MARTEAERPSAGTSEGAEPAVEPLPPRPLASTDHRRRPDPDPRLVRDLARDRRLRFRVRDSPGAPGSPRRPGRGRPPAGGPRSSAPWPTGIDPESGRPFGDDVAAIFRSYLERNVPGEGEQLLTVPSQGVAPPRPGDNTDELQLRRLHRALADAWTTSSKGDLDTPAGRSRYIGDPARARADGPLGSFVVASFIAGERGEVDEAIRIVAVVAAAVLLLGSVARLRVAGRVSRRCASSVMPRRSLSGTHMARRIQAEADDELADLGRAFNPMLDRLESAFASQREFIRDVSHELRTPIAVSRGHLELLAEGHFPRRGGPA